MLKLRGTYCAALTPIHDDYSIDKKLFLAHCKNLLSEGLDGLAIFGTTGEANSFNVNEKIEAIHYLIDNGINPDKIIAGTGQCSVTDTVLLSKEVSQLKVKGILVLPAFFYKNVKDDGIVEYYKQIVEGVGDENLHYVLYNIPQVSGIKINISILERLINLFPNNIIGMKDSSGDLDNMLQVIKSISDFSLFSGSDSLALKVCQYGGAGAITATSNISGKLLSYLINNHENESNIENFQELQNLQVQIRSTLFNQEPISALKAFLSVNNNDENWNRITPPLNTIIEPQKDKTVIALIELIKKMEELLSNS
ncbi:MAG: 4-hydroxy-tetrahydrodipicolinate synthase [Alphaproteobacteria bacterium MarineAlpha5_Bin7]|nr:MAG: 4-hydroxy-tetrahydrodipicolinate synthase [Alphaproteobacteria bacterium MarineAlpha5_Bin7]